MTFGPSDRYYDPPDPPEPCCDERYEPDHDYQACMDGQAEDAAEARAEREREDRMLEDGRWMP
jgi:hypothetical protein